MDKDILKLLHQMGLTPLDWVDAKQFSKLTGIAEQKLPHRKQHWPENVVWTRESNNIYYSIRGYNKWMTQQADIRYRKACGLDRDAFRSTLAETVSPITSRSHTQSLRKASRQLLKLDVT
jgi:predicted mannosyl-3-phosphoglycerate phosphatase (HAD superfamily)